MRMKRTTSLVLGLAMAILSGCGNDGREMALPTTVPPVPTTAPITTSSVLVVDPSPLPAESALPTAPPTTVSAEALADSPALCGPYAKVISLEESRAVIESQGEAAMIASEQRRTLELDRLNAALSPDTPPDVLAALDSMRTVEMTIGVPDAVHDAALDRVREHFGPLCGVGV